MGSNYARRNNHASRGRRVYATPSNESELPTPEWDPRSRTWKMLAENERATRSGSDVKGAHWGESKIYGANGDDGMEIRRRSNEQAACDSEAVVGYQGSQPQERKAGNDLRSAATLLLDNASKFIFEGLCESCTASIRERLTSLATGIPATTVSHIDVTHLCNEEEKVSCNETLDERGKRPGNIASQRQDRKSVNGARADASGFTASNIIRSALNSIHDAPAYRTRSLSRQVASLETLDDASPQPAKSSPDQQGILNVVQKKDFCFFDQVNGKTVNILEGLELHSNVLNKEEQQDLINYVYELQELGRRQKLRGRTYSEPRKWMRGKGRVTIQFGCCYNYAVDKDGNPPGIIREEEVDEIPPKIGMIIKRMVEWQVLPPSCIPDSCIVNIYDVGDCIPPHIDHHDFVRPFCTLSLLSECNIIFGTNLKIAGPGEFVGSFSLPLPTGSVLILNGNGADVAKHAVPAVPTQRISITFRKMDPLKVPVSFKPDKELLSTKPLLVISEHPKSTLVNLSSNLENPSIQKSDSLDGAQFSLESDFPALERPLSRGRRAPDGRPGKLRVQ